MFYVYVLHMQNMTRFKQGHNIEDSRSNIIIILHNFSAGKVSVRTWKPDAPVWFDHVGARIDRLLRDSMSVAEQEFTLGRRYASYT